MLEITEIIEALEMLVDGGNGTENISVDEIANSLTYSGVDLTKLSPVEVNEVVAEIGKQITFGDSWTDPVDDGKGIYDRDGNRFGTYSEFVAGVNGRPTYQV